MAYHSLTRAGFSAALPCRARTLVNGRPNNVTDGPQDICRTHLAAAGSCAAQI